MTTSFPPSPAAALAVILLSAGAGVRADAASAADLLPHRAVYDLALDDRSASGFDAVEGRVVVELTREDCKSYGLDYRFVARFVGEDETSVVDQHIELTEPEEGTRLRFSNVSEVDGQKGDASIGEATTSKGVTTVAYAEPSRRTVTIPAAAFPIAHTRRLIEAARNGAFVYETPIFDGDPEAGKETRSTSIISDARRPANGSPADAETQDERPGADVLSGLKRWRVSEAYYDEAGEPDSEPDFSTSYTLYENGVSDDLVLNFDGYSLAGAMSEFTPLADEECAPASAPAPVDGKG